MKRSNSFVHNAPVQSEVRFENSRTEWDQPPERSLIGIARPIESVPNWGEALILLRPTRWPDDSDPVIQVHKTSNARPADVPRTQPTPTPHDANAEEAAIITSYFHGHPEFR